jgi:phosphinothricin acetyltransferase
MSSQSTEPCALIRDPLPSDLEPLIALYNHYIRETAVTFDLNPFTVDERRPWFEKFALSGRYRLLVAELEGKVVGYASSSKFREKQAYDTTVETSVYLSPAATGKGIGRQLYAALFAALEGEGVHRALGGITLPNEASVALHTAFGFKPVGIMTECGYKFSQYHDVVWYEKGL